MKFLQILRPTHWIKNIFVFAALVFGKKLFIETEEMLTAIYSAIGAFVCFCLASSAVYIFNDIIDRRADGLHPYKHKRPIASGEVHVIAAGFLSILCGIVSVICSYVLAPRLAAIVFIYIFLMVLYSVLLKKMMILDCVVISTGFCLRAIAGAIAIGVFISPWLIICTFALCLFLSFGKRRSEIAMLGDGSEFFRKTLAGYTPELLTHMLSVTGVLAVVCFLLYSMDERTKELFGTNNLVYTTPLVLYCVFRFSALIQKGIFSGPVELILHDIPFQTGFALWVLACMAIIYTDKIFSVFGNMWAY